MKRVTIVAMIAAPLLAFSTQAFNITIDGSALNSTSATAVWRVNGVGSWRPSVDTLSLGAGNYLLYSLGSSLPTVFTVDAAGLVQYGAAESAYLSGAGTSTLTILGFTITVDGSALSGASAVVWRLNGVLDWTNGVHTAVVIPGSVLLYLNGSGSPTAITVDNTGNIQYAAAAAAYLSGAGTDTLTVDGFTVTIDGSALTSSSATAVYRVNAMLNWTSGSQSFTGLPGSYLFYALGTGQPTTFSIDANGNIQYAAALENYLSGAGTTTLTVDGFNMTIDATSLGNLYRVNGVLGWTTNVNAFTAIPGNYLFYVNGSGSPTVFTVDGAGNFQYDGSISTFAGAGTDTLTVSGIFTNFDGTPLGYAYRINGVVSWVTGLQQFSMVPGAYLLYSLASGTPTTFVVDSNGKVQYDPSITYLAGAGTNTLTINGLTVTIDGTPLGYAFRLNGVFSWVTTAQTVQLLPGGHLFYSLASGSPVAFSVDLDGNVQYAAALTFLSGEGTDTLTVNGHLVRVDGSAPGVLFRVNGIFSWSSGAQDFAAVPGGYLYYSIDNSRNFSFQVDADGLIQFDGSLTYLDGDGTTTLTVCDGVCPACTTCDTIVAEFCELAGDLAPTSVSGLAAAIRALADPLMLGRNVCNGSLACLQSILNP